MNMDEVVQRINQLARKLKTVGLTESELEEQQRLRKRYIEAFKSSLRNQLDSITVVDNEDQREGNK